jgi:cytochrome P450 PksS
MDSMEITNSMESTESMDSVHEISIGDLISPDAQRHPAALVERLRTEAPLAHVAAFAGFGGGWVATTYDDVSAILKDHRFIRDVQKVVALEADAQGDHAQGDHAQSAVIADLVKQFAWRRDMLQADPPDHTRLRGLVSQAFTPRMIEQLRPRIQQIADTLLDALQDKGRMDLIADFALPLPITVISEMLGIPASDRAQFRDWSHALVNATGDIAALAHDATIAASMEAFRRYIIGLLAEKRAHPGDDLTTSLIQVEERGDALSEDELISMIFLLIVAGHVTTVNLIGNGTLALLEHPDQLRLLRQDPSLLPAAIEELLRYTPPVTFTTRWASEDVPLHGQVIHKGEMVFISLAGADMDPAQFPHPDTLDLTREEKQHLAFGKGIHYCLGAPLARLEGQIAIGTLLHRLPQLRLACAPEELAWNPSIGLRGLASLPVAF